MGLFEKIFGPRPANPEQKLVSYFKTLNSYSPTYTSFEGGLYEMELTRAAIHSFATHVSKLRPELVGDARADLKGVLETRPNPYMDTSKYLYRLATIYSVQNNAFIVPLEDPFGRLVGYYPLLPQSTEIRELNGEAFLRYRFASGQYAAIEFERVGLLNQYQYKDDFFGTDNKALFPTLQLMHTQNQGIIEGIKNATSFRFLARVSKNLNDDDLKEEQKRFTGKNMAQESGGVLLFDTKYADVKQIESSALIVNPRQQELIRENVYTYFGTNEAILTNSFTEEQWNAYYEGKVEPFAIQLSLVHSGMTFTPDQLLQENEILFTTNRLQYASNTTKLNIVTQLFDRGMLTHNQGREIFNMTPIDGGDKYFIRKEYSEVSKLDNQNQEA